MERNEFEIENNIITSPGKFEGCHEIVLPFYESAMCGCADEIEEEGSYDVYIFEKFTPKELNQWPELRETVKLELIIDDMGFVYVGLKER
jgi:hypothetical protein